MSRIGYPIEDRREKPPVLPPLQPCPFCGGKAKLQEYEPDPEACTGFAGFHWWGVVCTGCHAHGPYIDEHWDKGVKAALAWNRRG